MTEAAGRSAGGGRSPGKRRTLPELRGIVALAVVAALLVLPLAHLQPNRILSGVGYRLWQWPAPALGPVALAGLAAIALAGGFLRQRALATALSGLAAALLLAAAGQMASALLPPGRSFARVSLGSGFWIGVLGFGLMAADGLVKLSMRPAARVAVTAVALGVTFAILGSGLCQDLSILREYRNHADTFWGEAGQHLVLVLGSLVPAVLVGIPLGYLCHRFAPLRSAALPVLEGVQTVPSIAMFGLLMAPLAALAAAWPPLQEYGIRGIGSTPALIALVLYSLLPIVANTFAGFEGIDRRVVEAARGMGMSRGRRLAWIEGPLALPVIVTGIRVVLVQNIGLAAVAALIGAGGLGSFVFRGMNQAAADLVLLGAVPILVLALASAILLDALTEALEGRSA